MLSTYLRADAVKRLRHGIPWVFRDEIVSMNGTPTDGEPVELRDQEGQLLGLGDVDLQAPVAIRRIGLPDEPAEGLIHRHLRAAQRRRALWLEDPRYARLVNDDGDGLPGLIVDRYDSHYVVQTLSRSMDARLPEIVLALREVMGAASVTLRNDTPLRAHAKLPVGKPHVLFGAPPRWCRLTELGARMTCDLLFGRGTGYAFNERETHRVVARISQGARVLDVASHVGGLFVHAGLHGARHIVAAEEDADLADLARENAEVNGLMTRTRVENASPLATLEGVRDKFDLVLFRVPEVAPSSPVESSELVTLTRLAVRATGHGGRLVLLASSDTAEPSQFDDQVALACELEGRLAYQLCKPGVPADFPTVLGSPSAQHLNTLALELS